MSTTQVERLVASLEASTTKFDNALRRAQGLTNQTATRIEKRFSDMERKIEGSMSNVGSKLAQGVGRAFNMAGVGVGAVGGIAAGVMGAREIIAMADAWTNMQNKLSAAGTSSVDMARIQQQIVDIAIASRSPLEGVATLYTRIQAAAVNLGATSQDVAVATQAVAQALKMYGATGSEAASAMQQFSQAMASGVLRGDEFNSLNENAQPIIQAIAKEFGVASTELRAMAENGELVANRVLRAIVNEAPAIERAFASSIPTVESAITNLETRFKALIGTMQGTGKEAGALATAINGLADAFGYLEGRARAAQQAQRAAVLEGPATVQSGLDALRSKLDNPNLSGRDRASIEERIKIEEARFRLAVKAKEAAEADGDAVREINRVKGLSGMEAPFTYSPFGGPQPRAKPEGAALSARERGIGVPESDLQRELRTYREKTVVLEQAAKMVGLNARETEYAKAKQDMLNAAEREKISLTPTLVAQIDQTARAYADTKIRIEEMEKAQKKAIETADQLRSDLASGMATFGSDLRSSLQQGMSAMEAFSNASMNLFNRLADRLLEIAAMNLVGMAFGAQGTPMGGGLLGSLLGTFGGTRALGGSVQPGRSFMVGENGPERFVATTPGQIMPNRSSGGIVIQGDTFNISGSNDDLMAKMERQMKAREDRMYRTLGPAMRDTRSRGK
jgi:tape measure domain-containing protein